VRCFLVVALIQPDYLARSVQLGRPPCLQYICLQQRLITQYTTATTQHVQSCVSSIIWRHQTSFGPCTAGSAGELMRAVARPAVWRRSFLKENLQRHPPHSSLFNRDNYQVSRHQLSGQASSSLHLKTTAFKVTATFTATVTGPAKLSNPQGSQKVNNPLNFHVEFRRSRVCAGLCGVGCTHVVCFVLL
jgi:hypothetical protein